MITGCKGVGYVDGDVVPENPTNSANEQVSPNVNTTEPPVIKEDYYSKIQGHWYCNSSEGILIMSIEAKDFMCGYFATDFLRQGTITDITELSNGSINVTVNFPEIYIMEEHIPQSTDVLNFTSHDDYQSTLIHHSFDGNSYTYTYAGDTYEKLSEICDNLY